MNKFINMFDQLTQLIKENADSLINNDPNIPSDKKEEIVGVSKDAIVAGFQNVLAKGGIKDVMKIFSGNDSQISNNPVTSTINQAFEENASQRLGLSSSQISGLASSIIPMILGKLVSKTNDPSDNSFNIQDIFNQLSNGKTAGINLESLLNKFKGGLDQDGDGDVDFEDLKSMLGGGGGIMDKLKGILK